MNTVECAFSIFKRGMRGVYGDTMLCGKYELKIAPLNPTRDCSMSDDKSQADKFREAARQLECDDDDERFKERVKKLVRHKPVEKPGS